MAFWVIGVIDLREVSLVMWVHYTNYALLVFAESCNAFSGATNRL